VTSERKVWTNRRNSRASTGPRTASGKAAAAQNARRHGLRVAALSDPVLSVEVAKLAREIAGEDADERRRELAQRIAEAQIDVARVRQARHHRPDGQWTWVWTDGSESCGRGRYILKACSRAVCAGAEARHPRSVRAPRALAPPSRDS
jgi:hypothetical protein